MSSTLEHPDHPRESSGSGSGEGYVVEMRYQIELHDPIYIGDQRVTASWTVLRTNTDPARGGIPNGRSYMSPIFEICRVLDYASAEAFRWNAVAQAMAIGVQLETRLVRHEISWSWNKKPIGAMKRIGNYDLTHPARSAEQDKCEAT